MESATDMRNMKRITIEIEDRGEKCQVSVSSEQETSLTDYVCACEFLIYVVASESGMEYDEACRRLVEGSKTYQTQRPFRIIMGKGEDHENEP